MFFYLRTSIPSTAYSGFTAFVHCCYLCLYCSLIFDRSNQIYKFSTLKLELPEKSQLLLSLTILVTRSENKKKHI